MNLGEDTDTTGAVTGALAGFYYIDTIPENWMNELARTEDLQKLADK